MSSYFDFLDKVRKSLPEYLPPEYRDADIQVKRTEKHLGESYDGICFRMKDSSVGVCMNLKSVYENVDGSEEFSAAMTSIASNIMEAIHERPDELEMIMGDLEFFIKHVMIQPVSSRSIEDIRDDIPFRMWNDMALIYRMILPQEDEGILTCVVTNGLLSNFGLDEEELYEILMETLPENYPVDFRKFCDDIFVAGCNDHYKGAGCMFYPDFPEKAGELIGNNFYILPFTVHSVLLVRDGAGMSKKFMENISFRLSTYETAPEDRLSKEIYYCNITEKTIERTA